VELLDRAIVQLAGEAFALVFLAGDQAVAQAAQRRLVPFQLGHALLQGDEELGAGERRPEHGRQRDEHVAIAAPQALTVGLGAGHEHGRPTRAQRQWKRGGRLRPRMG